ncbi:hypothetical protein [Cod iridovirus]|uniref:Uncharacterized protein n=2 Tax=Frog virus 3 TaxID=10493 RepID=A0A1B2IU96_FRG3V|nr:hypothetical protein BGV90_gp036 [Ranavirus maximus]ANZ57063.1 hypothetical protein [Cod iridovirus]ANZ57161.1 hypothetical protein [Ranavirus maximus]
MSGFRILDSAGPQGQSSYTWEAKIAQVQHDMVAMINTFNQQIAVISGTIMGGSDQSVRPKQQQPMSSAGSESEFED